MNGVFFTYVTQRFKLIIIFAMAIIVIRTFAYEPGRVNGRSMEPTFYDAELFVINKWALLLEPPKRGDIVQFVEEESGDSVIKRVIGLPGEQVKIEKHGVTILNTHGNYFTLDEPYLEDGVATYAYPERVMTYQVIGEHEYFLMGDGRLNSVDSRHYGPINRKQIRGLVK